MLHTKNIYIYIYTKPNARYRYHELAALGTDIIIITRLTRRGHYRLSIEIYTNVYRHIMYEEEPNNKKSNGKISSSAKNFL